MTEEAKNNNHDRWNVASLKEYFDFAMYTLDEKLITIIKKDEEAVKVANTAMDHRLDGMNKIKEQLNDQAKEFMKTEIFEAKHDLISSKLESIQKIVFVGLGIWIVIQGIIVVVLVTVFKK